MSDNILFEMILGSSILANTLAMAALALERNKTVECLDANDHHIVITPQDALETVHYLTKISNGAKTLNGLASAIKSKSLVRETTK